MEKSTARSAYAGAAATFQTLRNADFRKFKIIEHIAAHRLYDLSAAFFILFSRSAHALLHIFLEGQSPVAQVECA